MGAEHLDITEIDGGDSLYEADGIIKESEENVSRLFGCKTLYSTEGSSHCLRAMLYLSMLYARKRGKEPLIAATRNIHKTFMSAVALLNIDVNFIYPEKGESFISCQATPQEVENFLCNCDRKPTAVYLTSPDYLGDMADIALISQICHRHDVLLLVDNAHGAYLKFLEDSEHPVDLGADMCCDSAHKTLPVLTGGAYLHLADSVVSELEIYAKNALMMFGSTSPSYLILQSLDAANDYMEKYPQRLKCFLEQSEQLKKRLMEHGYNLYGKEKLKITILAKSYGYTGEELASILKKENIFCEFSDRDYLVLMLTPEIKTDELNRLGEVLCSVPKKPAIIEKAPDISRGERVLSVREAIFSLWERVPAEKSVGRILATASVGCPPAIPVLVCGERITKETVFCFEYYGIDFVDVVK